MNFIDIFLKRIITVLILFVLKLNAQQISLASPDNLIDIQINVSKELTFQVLLNKKEVIDKVIIGLETSDGRAFGTQAKLISKNKRFVKETMVVEIPNKEKEIESIFNELKMSFRGNYQLIFRAYNDGIAYRFVDNKNKPKNIIYEQMDLNFPEGSNTFFPWEESTYSHNERLYNRTAISNLNDNDFCSLPVLFTTKNGKVLFSEASLYNYPGMFLEKKSDNSLSSKFPNYVLKAIPAGLQISSDETLHFEEEGSDRTQEIVEEANYIAKTKGSRAFPWRVFIISNDDRTFVESSLITQLSGKSKITDTSWIKPGKVAWDWWNANNVYGMDFRAGINQETYKYYIDFASENDIEFILLDEGWTKSTTEIYQANTEIDIVELIQYAKSKNVGVILWVLWKPLSEDTDGLLKLYSSWGATGIKVDFMQRNDQYMVHSYEKIAEIASSYKMTVNYHGAFKPSGIERKWPNILSYEGVMGNEQNKWRVDHFPYSDEPYPVSPEHNLTLPFIRMVAGAMDFTPGAMTNVNRYDYKWSPNDNSPDGFDSQGNPLKTEDNMHAFNTRPMALGTRAHQVAMYTVFESPLQMLCDSPTIYKKEQETVDFITQIPTTWDETVVIEASVSDYIIIARRKGNNWYLAGMTDWTPRKFEIDLYFLEKGIDYKAQIYKDGINADRNAMDYKIQKKVFNKNTKLNVSMSDGGGFSIIFEFPKNG